MDLTNPYSNWPYSPLGGQVGFGMAVYDDAEAMRYFSGLSSEERQRVMDDMRGMTRQEARSYAKSLIFRGHMR